MPRPPHVETAAASDEELSLLLGVAADLSDPLPKLVYADWLEERDDPRGPFLRAFVEAAGAPRGDVPPGDGFPMPWRHAVGVRVVEVVRAFRREGRFGDQEAALLESMFLRRARPTLYLFATPTPDAALSTGATKFGGRPDVPTDEGWPASCVFCAQIRLSELRGTLAGQILPREGLLSFSHDPAGDALVRLHPEAGPFHRPPPPGREPRRWYPLASGALRIVEAVDVPAFEEGLWPQEYLDNDWPGDLRDALLPGARLNSTAGPHQLLGHGCPINRYPQPEETPGVRRLATFASDEEAMGYYWGDSGQPFYYITEADLAAGRFDRVAHHAG